MIDTGDNVTIIACSEWLEQWELEPVSGLVSGIGGLATSWRSKEKHCN